MVNRVRVLSERTINQIAAGEVIENPASVVKELVENAIDAGATQVQVALVGGGFHLIRVVDNGSGMGRDDAVLALERHATSKIGDVDDLERLSTMGFRGEALASIGAVSKMTLLTSDGEATKVEMEGGVMRSVEAAARQRGTTIEVRHLFYNVPARKKFQKSATVSAGEISRMMTKLSLGYPEIGFTLLSHERELLRTEGGDLESRVRDVLGRGFLGGTTSVDFASGEIVVRGFIGLPRNARSNRSGQYLYINGRNVVCPEVQEAVSAAYATMLQPKEYPIFVLHVTMPGEMLDVNVHPQKREVRLLDGEVVREVVMEAVSASLYKTYDVPKVEVGSLDRSFLFESMRLQEEPSEDEVFEEALLPWEESVPVGVGVFRHYLLADAATIGLLGGEGLAVVDLEAAAARIHYETIVQEGERVEKQTLLFPETVELSPADAAVLSEHVDLMEVVGISVRQFGETTFIVEAIADYYEGQDFLSLVRAFLEELRLDVKGKVERVAMRACRFVKKNRGPYAMPEAVAILTQLLKCKAPLFCPAGNSTIVKVDQDELKGWFALQQTDQAVKKTDGGEGV